MGQDTACLSHPLLGSTQASNQRDDDLFEQPNYTDFSLNNQQTSTREVMIAKSPLRLTALCPPLDHITPYGPELKSLSCNDKTPMYKELVDLTDLRSLVLSPTSTIF